MERRVSGWIAVLLCAGLLAGCGAGSTVKASTPTTKAATRTAGVPVPTALATVDPTRVAQLCNSSGGPFVMVNVHNVWVGEARFALAYPYNKLPDGIPLQPYQIPADQVTQPTMSPLPTNPTLTDGSGYAFYICNTSSQSHTVTGISGRIESFSPFSGQINEWNICDGPYNTTERTAIGGCGGALLADTYVHLSFPSSPAVGTTVAATPSSAIPSSPAGPLPITIAPGKGILVDVGMAVPSAGTYQFSFGVALDHAPPVFVPVSTPNILMAPHARQWTGMACTSSAMQAQIPASTQTAYYVCPV